MYKYIFIVFFLVGCWKVPTPAVNKHTYFANGFHNIIEISSKTNISEARVYFKDSRSRLYQLYVDMKCDKNNCYAKLPLATSRLLFLDYVTVFKDSQGKIRRSKRLSIRKRDVLELPLWQKKYAKDTIVLRSELKIPPTQVRGFGKELKVKPTVGEDIWGVEVKLYKEKDLDNTPRVKSEEEMALEKFTTKMKPKLDF